MISPGPQPAVLTAALAGLLAAGAWLGELAVLPAVLLLQAVTAAGWFRLNGMWPARQGIALAFAAGLTGSVAAVLAPDGRALVALTGALGVWFLLIIVVQLRAVGMPADDRMDALTATAASAVLTVLAGGYLAAVAENRTAVVVAAAAVAAAALVRSVLRVRWAGPAVALLAAGGVGAAVGQLAEVAGGGLPLGAAAGAAALAGLRVASYDFPSRFVRFTAGVALPLTAAAPVAYLLAGLVG